MDALSSPVPVSDEVAKVALRDFFALVLELDGPSEVRRITEVFYSKIQELPQWDWSDNTEDGNLHVKPPAMAATNGQ